MGNRFEDAGVKIGALIYALLVPEDDNRWAARILGNNCLPDVERCSTFQEVDFESVSESCDPSGA